MPLDIVYTSIRTHDIIAHIYYIYIYGVTIVQNRKWMRRFKTPSP